MTDLVLFMALSVAVLILSLALDARHDRRDRRRRTQARRIR
jgi:hypothetical protein